MDYSPPGSSVHGISQARTLEWIAISFPSPRDLPDPGIELSSPALAGGFFTSESPGEPKIALISISTHNCFTVPHTLESLNTAWWPLHVSYRRNWDKEEHGWNPAWKVRARKKTDSREKELVYPLWKKHYVSGSFLKRKILAFRMQKPSYIYSLSLTH